MTTGTPQSQAILVANAILSVAEKLMNVYADIGTIDAQWNDQSVANSLATLQTVGKTADGGVGAVDSAPVFDHMINVQVYPTLIRSVSSLQVTQIKSAIDDIRGYINGQVVPQNPGARAILNVATGG